MAMAYTVRELTDAEKEAFLTDNYWGVLSFAGDDPYGIPVGYMYRKGDVLMGLSPTGRKWSTLLRAVRFVLPFADRQPCAEQQRNPPTQMKPTPSIPS